MNIEIVRGQRPPNYDLIRARFPMASRIGVLFAYDDKIYTMSSDDIPPELMAHERVHCERQQAMGVTEWWHAYITDKKFMYHEELLAHTAEYKHLIDINPARPYRRAQLKVIAKKLSAPLYGSVVTAEKAAQDILQQLGEAA